MVIETTKRQLTAPSTKIWAQDVRRYIQGRGVDPKEITEWKWRD